MQPIPGQALQLTYCTNVHRGETWAEVMESLRTGAEPIRERVAPGRRFGIGLRLSDAASIELAAPAALEEFQRYLAEKDFYIFTLNGFPFGRFHGAKVKEKVYAPDWAEEERVAYTNRLADILAALLPTGMEGSISTSPGTFKEWIRGPEHLDAIAANLARCALHLERGFERTGRSIRLALEPEPLCMMETMGEAAEFWRERLRPAGARRLADEAGLAEAEALAMLDRRLGICYDACHMAVEFEGAAESLAALDEAGIAVGKFQISSALRLRPSEGALRELRKFADAVYLHQVVARMPGGEIRRWKDINPALADAKTLAQAEELRVHCHVPLFMEEREGIASTSDHIDDLLRALGPRAARAQMEIETYTWDVLPVELKKASLAEAVAGEFQWLIGRLGER